MGISKDIKVGGKYKTKSFGLVEVITYKDCDNIEVRFESNGHTKWVSGGNLRKGEVKNEYHPSIYGVGYFGVGDFNCDGIGGYNGAYSVWKGILCRCYAPQTEKMREIYHGCSVAEEWHNFQNFAKWYVGRGTGKRLAVDKDLLYLGNREYSPDKCVLIPQWLNNFTLTSAKNRGSSLVGSSFIKRLGKYRAYCLLDRKQVYLGLFDTELEAHNAWKSFKLSIAKSRKGEMDFIDKRIYPNIVKIINNAK